MGIHAVTPTHFTYRCTAVDKHGRVCGHEETVEHGRLIVQELEDFQTKELKKFITHQCGANPAHWYCPNPDLEEWEETAPTRDKASQEQVRNIRALHKHLGLPVK